MNPGPKKGCGYWVGKKRNMPWLKEHNFKKGVIPIHKIEQGQQTLKIKILDKIKEENDLCIEWQGAKDGCGYGGIRINGKYIKVHRLVWSLKNGEIPIKMEVCHHCDNPSCFNPKHLFLGTHTDNMQDMKTKGRNRIYLGLLKPRLKKLIYARKVDK